MGFLYLAFFAAILYLAPVALLCRKVANRTTAKMGWTMAFLLIAFPVILLVIGGVIDANRAAS
ncbi:hypothetical protein [Streptomyces kanamyceticus]|uniref:Uncharacterized protein n=1 Tax=Streptomyces kanamyceticus TaxID=1967 RepID=A0A5J6GE02_STRKN|nr:hypothetical protein [Streptomyces kanamyceticus]QEU93729.1 hypothetical protein CP970_24985 [Streptomyces kanamyceticus]